MKGDRKKRIPIERAVQELQIHCGKIQSVNEWAHHMGYSRAYFSRRIKVMVDTPPKQVLAEVKLEMIKKEIVSQPKAIGYHIAVNVGLQDEKALYKFLTTYFDTTLTDLKDEFDKTAQIR